MNDTARPTSSGGWLVAVFVGGGAAAFIDIVYACVRQAGFGRSVEWTLQSVASGWLGMAAFESGTPGALLGLASHFFILFVAAYLYLVASRRFPFLATQAVACGALYGVGIYLFMNFVVLKLSAFPFKLSYDGLRLLEGFTSHALFVGMPIALAVRKWGAPQPAA